jgi:hypothetical protein
MIDDDDDEMYNEATNAIHIIDKLDILISLIEKNSYEKQRALLSLLEETKFHLLHAWNETQYYRELCEGYEAIIKKAESGLK